MKYIDWNVEKNEKLKEERGVSFDDAVNAIFEGRIFGKADHPNQKRYPNQKMYLVQIGDYIFVVPFVQDKEKIFLKTMFPSRKYTKKYLEKGAA